MFILEYRNWKVTRQNLTGLQLYSQSINLGDWKPTGNTSNHIFKLCFYYPITKRADSLEKPLMMGKIEGSRRRGLWKMRWLDR